VRDGDFSTDPADENEHETSGAGVVREHRFCSPT